MREVPDSESFWHLNKGPERVREAVQKGGGYNRVAELSGISTTSLNNYLRGRELKTSTAVRLAEACGVTPQWLLFGDTSPSKEPPIIQSQITSRDGADGTRDGDLVVSSLTIFASGGDGVEATDDFTYHRLRLPASTVTPELRREAKNLVAIRLRGDSMEPTIDDGDTIIINTNERSVVNGKVYVLRLNDDLLAKRLSLKTNGNLVLTSDNSRYEPEEIDAQQARQIWEQGAAPAYVLGRVVWRGGAL